MPWGSQDGAGGDGGGGDDAAAVGPALDNGEVLERGGGRGEARGERVHEEVGGGDDDLGAVVGGDEVRVGGEGAHDGDDVAVVAGEGPGEAEEDGVGGHGERLCRN